MQIHHENIKKLLKTQNAVLVAHFYTSAEIQLLADETGGCVGDSLEMARFATKHPATTIVVAGVRFMGETVKILNPNKRILIPDMQADCSLDLDCPPDKFATFRAHHPDRTAVVYINTSAAVKAVADWVVTSSIALDVISYLHNRGEKILWAPDRHLGHYIQQRTGADMLLWHGACIVHEQFKAAGISHLKKIHPNAAILVHPEAPAAVVALADVVGSTSQLLAATKNLPNDTFIIATEAGILHKMRQQSPNKAFIMAPTAGHGATCKSCAYCPWMAKNTLPTIEHCLQTGANNIDVPIMLAEKALLPLQRMLNFHF